MPDKIIFEPSRPDLTIQLIGDWQGATTGISRYARQLYQILGQAGVKVLAGEIAPPPVPEALNRLTLKARFNLKGLLAAYPLALPTTPPGALLHLTSQNLASSLLLRRSKQPSLVTVHDMITLSYRHDPEISGYLKSYRRFLEDLTAPGLKKATRLLADSEQTRQDIISYLGYPANQIRVVHLGVDLANFQPALPPQEFLDCYKLSLEADYLLFVGSDDPRKNLPRLLRSFAQLVKKFPQLRLLKVGTNFFAPQRQQLLALLNELDISDRVLFFDGISDRDLTHFYNLAKVFVFPSLLEGFGLPPLEALACGTPVAASNHPPMPEILGDAVVYFNPRDPEHIAAVIEQILTDTTLAERLRQAGPAQAAQYSWAITARKTLDVYNELV